MSNALALAATLRVIASLLDDGITRANVSLLGAAHTTVSPPDLIALGGNLETDHLNLFLYTVTMNSGWRNVAAVRNGAGERIARPPLAVDLHFLLSAYGAHQYHPEMLLGIGMQALHEHPFLDRGSIQSLFAGAATTEDTAMATSQLDQQIEQIKIAPHDLSADELYKLWSAFGSKCRPSAAYVATVVLVTSRGVVRSAPPVMARNIGVVTFERPVIEDVEPGTFELAGPVQLKLTGNGFQPPGTMAQFGTTRVAFDSTAPDSALVTVPGTVVPGMNMLKVVRSYSIGQPPDKLIGDSSPVGIIVQPRVTGTTLTGAGPTRRLAVNLVPNCAPTQVATLLLDQLNAPPGVTPNRYAIDALPADMAGGTITFNAGDVASGNYLLRLQIDGTESVPAFDPNLGFTGPTVLL